jgi:hypothetical protein
MYIIDLATPLEVPRFLPKGGTWGIADVEWNPYPTRAEYIISTSADNYMFRNSTLLRAVHTNKIKLIWNLVFHGKTNIERVLQAHYHAITYINWHTMECETVVRTGIDSWNGLVIYVILGSLSLVRFFPKHLHTH